MKENQKLLGFYNYTVVLTYIGMLFGVVGIIRAFEGRYLESVLCLMMAGFCDMFDGTIAATRIRTEQEKCFGIQIDSFSDLICFGVLPGMLVYNANQGNPLVLWISALYILCALIRLAYFNVDEQERQQISASSREMYSGLPVTLSALIVPVIYCVCHLSARQSMLPLAAGLLVMAALFLLPFPLKKAKKTGKILILVCGVLELILVLIAGLAG